MVEAIRFVATDFWAKKNLVTYHIDLGIRPNTLTSAKVLKTGLNTDWEEQMVQGQRLLFALQLHMKLKLQCCYLHYYNKQW